MSLTTPIITTLISKIKTTLNKVDTVRSVLAHPLAGNPSEYPAVVFILSDFSNEFSSTQENMKEYTFTMWLQMSTEEYSDQDVFEEILPNAVDEILEQFDQDWDIGTIDGHRTWALVNGGIMGKTEEDKGQLAWAEMTLRIKLSTSN